MLAAAWSTGRANGRRKDRLDTQFDFLGFSFHGRIVHDRERKLIACLGPAVSRKALKRVNQAIRSLRLNRSSSLTLAALSALAGSTARNWANYHGAFYLALLKRFLIRISLRLGRSAGNNYKPLRGHKCRSSVWLKRSRDAYSRARLSFSRLLSRT